ncbi:MAG TPA: class III lanthionine synthetase LanKC [Gammaproteobacteria bacterium]|nr:class III lanthionine synthetase LanKC [Gammaproteobacteria bacterium]
MAHRRYFETLEQLHGSVDYRGLVDELLPAGWTHGESGLWYRAEPPNSAMPEQGFKLHVSAVLDEAELVIGRVVPILAAYEVPFKVLRSRELLTIVNSKQFGRGAAGKFFTIYPSDEREFLALGDALAGALDGADAPYILSDRRFRDAQAVYYRYGGFRSATELTPPGHLRYLIRDGYGRWIEDRRSPYFELPSGIHDPLAGEVEAAQASGPIVLDGRFEPEEAVTFSTSGGIYKALDRRTGARVLVKEARPGIYGATLREGGVFATDLLEHEGRVLGRLTGVSQVPRFVARFHHWEHEYLVEEYCAGFIPWAAFRARSDFAIAAAPRDRTIIRRFCVEAAEAALNLLDAVAAVHERGVVLGDLSPANVLVDPDTCAVRLIDFEGAHVVSQGANADGVSSYYGTQGFMRAERLRGEGLGTRDDWYAAGMMLFGMAMPLEAFVALKRSSLGDFERQLTRQLNIPEPLFAAAGALREGDVARARQALDDMQQDAAGIAARLSRRRGRRTRDSRARRRAAEESLQRVLADLDATAEPERADRVWPGDFKVFSTNPWGFAFGAAGSLSLYGRAGASPPAAIVDRARAEPLDGTALLPPGLMAGHAGLAWAFASLGRYEDAERFAAAAASSSLLEQDPTLFHGLAGYGMTRLMLCAATGDSVHVEEAARAGHRLLDTAVASESGLRWACWGSGSPASGIGYGGAGIALFLLRLHEIVGERRFGDAAAAALEEELAKAKYPLKDGLPRFGGGDGAGRWDPYWVEGGAGVAAVLVRFAGAFEDERYRELACRVAAGAYTPVLSAPGQFLGTSGLGETMLDLHVLTGDNVWLERAWQLADVTRLFELDGESGVIYPGRFHLRRSHDYAFGSSGAGHFLLRMARGGDRLFHDPGPGFWAPRYRPLPTGKRARRQGSRRQEQ